MLSVQPKATETVISSATILPRFHLEKIEIKHILEKEVGRLTVSRSEGTLVDCYSIQVWHSTVQSRVLPQPRSLRVLKGTRDLMPLTGL